MIRIEVAPSDHFLTASIKLGKQSMVLRETKKTTPFLVTMLTHQNIELLKKLPGCLCSEYQPLEYSSAAD
ncbi:hypothetical protein [uncultured Gimesia sp.]|uniref:hypothetical protein n=1 Tax=uncultured Gimesia sp. TaxID=1678688 RepID=UPI0026034DA1|nr:hypothetical protein [uncultured Gimesia sp.]